MTSLHLALFFALATPMQSSATLAMSTEASSASQSFASFVAKYGRTYQRGMQEYEQRRALFELRLEKVGHHNSKPGQRWSAAVNHLTDWTEAELLQLRGLRVMKADPKSRRPVGMVAAHPKGQFLSQTKAAVLPEEKLWTHLNTVKSETSQGACGSCWAIAAATMLQANAEIQGNNRTFSAQEMVDCVPNSHHCGGTGGCDGSTVELAMNYVAAQGLATSEKTPYHGQDQTCTGAPISLLSPVDDGHHSLEDMIAEGFHAVNTQSDLGAALGLKGWERLAQNKYEPLMRAVAETGPVAVSVGAGDWSMYRGGLFDGCGKDAVIDHAVTLIGYGVDKDSKEKYWTIKNSWGLNWGENGNIRLLREEGDVHCGTDSQPSAGTGCDGGPTSVEVCGMCGILYDNVVAHFNKK